MTETTIESSDDRQADERDGDVIDALRLERIEQPRREVAAGEPAGVRVVVDAGQEEAHEHEHQRCSCIA